MTLQQKIDYLLDNGYSLLLDSKYYNSFFTRSYSLKDLLDCWDSIII